MFLILTIFAFVASLGYRIHSAGKLAVKNEALKQYTEKKSALEKELALLEYEDSKYSSLKYLESSASRMGLVRANEPLIAVEFNGGTSIAAVR
jgi:cell shape-determining protein MreC